MAKRVESKVFMSSTLENDAELFKTMREIEDNVRNGYGGFNQGFDKEDMMFLKERKDTETLHEQDLAEAEMSEYAALRSRTEEAEEPIKVAVKSKAEIRPPSKLVPGVKVTPKACIIKIIPKGSTGKPSSPSPSPKGGEPASKRLKGGAEAAADEAGTNTNKAVGVGVTGSAEKGAAAGMMDETEENGGGDGLAGLLGYSGSSDEDE